MENVPLRLLPRVLMLIGHHELNPVQCFDPLLPGADPEGGLWGLETSPFQEVSYS